MFKKINLAFDTGNILTGQMLNELYHFPDDCLSIKYDKYPDGILSGTEIISKNDSIFITKGLLKYDNKFFRMNTDINLTSLIKDMYERGELKGQIDYKLCFIHEKETCIDGRESQKKEVMKLNVSRKSEEIKGIVFAYFQLNNNTIFLDDDDIECTFWDMTGCLYSCRRGYTYHPYIFEQIAKKIENNHKLDSDKLMILNKIYEDGVVNINLIKSLVNHAKKLNYELYADDSLERRKSLLTDFIEIITTDHGIEEKEEKVSENEKNNSYILT